MSTVREYDNSLFGLVEPYIGHFAQLGLPARFSEGQAISHFAETATEKAAAFEMVKNKPYLRMYSRAQWPASHFAAALFKRRRPEVEWTAEFSDPLLLDVNGRERVGEVESGWVYKHGLHELFRQKGFSVNVGDKRLFYWCEVLAYVLADRIIFTNQNQMEYMLSYCNDPTIRDNVRKKAEIKPHPIPHEWLKSLPRAYHIDRNRTNMAYFGSFYSNRNLSLIFDSIGKLGDAERQRLRLYIFTGQSEEIHQQVESYQLYDTVIVRSELNYLDFLRSLDDFDVLIVNDADKKSRGGVNPYLPSKLSDYAASRTPILAIYDEGSELSRRSEPTYRCKIQGKTRFIMKMVAVLRELLAKKRSLRRSAAPTSISPRRRGRVDRQHRANSL